ncbi:hypothetical protein QVD17_15224 [Tagetes erecta]|uniref:Uncharacterized protein n=1 Tax=Tagetes erecta TaxID=13708 RepID=A0AAD8KPJ7_TARER|nr:hypothetical protein QVD17_15224 [Tagetes erecta]
MVSTFSHPRREEDLKVSILFLNWRSVIDLWKIRWFLIESRTTQLLVATNQIVFLNGNGVWEAIYWWDFMGHK